MTDKNEPKIRMVTLDKKSPDENSGSRAEERDCLCDKIEKPCVVDPPPCPTVHPCPCVAKPPPCPTHFECGCMCVRVEPPCPHPSCPCVAKPPTQQPCSYEVPCSNTTIPSNPKSENNQKEQQTPKEGKGKPKTFFKIAENKK